MVRFDSKEREFHSTPHGSDSQLIKDIEEMLANHDSAKAPVSTEQVYYDYISAYLPVASELAESKQVFPKFLYDYVRSSSHLTRNISPPPEMHFLQNLKTRQNERLNRKRIKQEMFASNTHDELLGLMQNNNLGQYIEDYYSHLKSRQEELDRDESPGVILQSLQSWAWFLIDYAESEQIPRVKMYADFFGCVELVWRLSQEPIPHDPDNEYYGNGRGIIVLTFYPSRLIHISVMSGAYGAEKRRIAFHGEFSHSKTRQILDIFKERLGHPNA